MGPGEFFTSLHAEFAAVVRAGAAPADLAEHLASRAFEIYERNIAIQGADLPELACRKNCPACCALQVTATAPEIFLLARYVRLIAATPSGAQLDLPGRIARAGRRRAGVDAPGRTGRRRPCPLLMKGVCIIHPVRPLACRGHAAFDRRACAAALAGRDVETPVSEPHLTLRVLVQTALQSALRAQALPWGVYELNRGLALALDPGDRLTAWAHGEDSLAPVAAEFDPAAAAAAFGALLGP
jgi:hypothetical protein